MPRTGLWATTERWKRGIRKVSKKDRQGATGETEIPKRAGHRNQERRAIQKEKVANCGETLHRNKGDGDLDVLFGKSPLN